MGWMVNVSPQPLYPGKDPVRTVQEAGWAPAPVWTGTENLATTGIRSPNRPARSKCNFNSMYIIYKCDLGPHNTTWRDACGPRTKGWRTMS